MKDENRRQPSLTFAVRLALLTAWLALAASWIGCASPFPQPDNQPRTASDFIGQPRPMP